MMVLQATEMSLWESMSLVRSLTPPREATTATMAMEAGGRTIGDAIISKHPMSQIDQVRWDYLLSLLLPNLFAVI